MELVCFILIIMFPFTVVYADYQSDALYALKMGLVDPKNVLHSWDISTTTAQDNPCTWFHVTCDRANHVIRIDLGNGGFEGSLVPDLGSLTSLQYLELYGNKINGSIPAKLGNLANLENLDLYGNSLTGSIPPELGNLNKLIYLRLNDNNLSGVVPDELKKLVPNLKVFNISGNPHLNQAI